MTLWVSVFFAEIMGLVSFINGIRTKASDDHPEAQKRGTRMMVWGVILALAPILFVGLVLYLTQGTRISTPWSNPLSNLW
ncbi:hypothetical protein [Thermosulfurimonas sp. F29]|uniref:hypothetical protein n=1 Tax=Thermosulfurimonas sp. F29 TaxID=2867247 RepID=UPI001C828910|nr:hypothetical protein [Thermosulfurimonas sp. F29]MBX6423386.1 hypothetical protein [Thermosulfurimonas sp. F29]